jgi:F5/8 type C domain
MSKRDARQRRKSYQPQGRKRSRRQTVIVGLVLCFGLSGVIVAQWKAARTARRTNALLVASAPQPPPTLSSSNPSREYLYAGGKLIATEEPQTSATPTPPPNNRINVALATNGGVATASSEYSSSYAASRANNGDRKGPGSGGSGDYWNDAAQNTFPDWLEIAFNGSKNIDEIDLFCLQNNFTNPGDPTETMTFSWYGLSAFEVQYWNGSGWANVPGGSVTANNLVWRKFTFSPLTTTKVRVLTNASLDGYSRITELEAWGYAASQSEINVALAANGATATASSEYNSDYAASRANNGDSKGPGASGNGDYWNDAAPHTFPDWLQIDFNGQKTIRRIELFMLQDTYWAPVEPTTNMTFTYYGLRDFQVQHWTGSAWADVPGGDVTNNNKVWRTFTFSDIATTKIRVLATATPDGWSRLTEVEAWGN